jgi:hypothetical protein
VTREITATFQTIRDGSVTLVLEAANSKVASEYSRLIDAIVADDPAGLSASARQSAARLSEKARQRNWSFQLRNGSGHAASISPVIPLFAYSSTLGATSVVARVIRVGGDGKRTATIQIAGGQKLTADVLSQELTRALGQRLYETLELHCEAAWSNKDRSILSLKIVGIGEYSERERDPQQALAELSEISGGIWDAIDPTSYVREIRSSEG